MQSLRRESRRIGIGAMGQNRPAPKLLGYRSDTSVICVRSKKLWSELNLETLFRFWHYVTVLYFCCITSVFSANKRVDYMVVTTSRITNVEYTIIDCQKS